MPSIHSYTNLIRLVLSESGKYFLLLLLAVLAVRLWRRAAKLSGRVRWENLFLATIITAITITTGWLSICHSMSLMYFHFGMKAFRDYKLGPALSLFDSSLQFRKNADALGGRGVCLLFDGDAGKGIQTLDQARSMRHGKGTPFENFYEGLFYFFQNDTSNAVPLLEAASEHTDYVWAVTKLFAVIQLDRNRPDEASKLMQPYLQAKITEPDQAYIVARLELAEGKNAEARTIVDNFFSTSMAPYWKQRFEQLRITLKNGKT